SRVRRASSPESPRAARSRSRSGSRARSRTRPSCRSSTTAATAIFPRACFRTEKTSGSRPPRMTPILAFDIETVPDIAGLRLLHGIDPAVPDRDVAEFAFRERRARAGNDFLPLHQHRVVAIACALRHEDSFRCWALGDAGEGEADLIRRFFDGIEKYTPQL